MRKLFDLAQANRGKGAGLRSEAAGDSDTAHVYVYDMIDSWWGVSATDFARTMAAIDAPNIVLHVNSPGGDVFEARAMMAAIAGHPATVTARIDGLAASAATMLTLACANVEIVEGGFYMIHKAWTFAMGNADDLRETSALLDKIDGVAIDAYAKRTGKSADDVVALLTAETWLTAEEAIEGKFADVLVPIGGKTAEANASARAFNLAVYERAPKALTEAPTPDESVRTRMLSRLKLYERTN